MIVPVCDFLDSGNGGQLQAALPEGDHIPVLVGENNLCHGVRDIRGAAVLADAEVQGRVGRDHRTLAAQLDRRHRSGFFLL